MPEKKVPKFYLACPSEDGSNTEIHKNIAEAAENLGAQVLNRDRADIRQVLHAKKGDKFSQDMETSLPQIKEADAFAGYLGLRSFWPGIELGYLLGKGINGVVFTDEKSINARLLSLFPNLNVTYLSSLEDKDRINQAVRNVLFPPGPTDYIRTGNLTLDLEYKRVLLRKKHIPLHSVEYEIAERLALSMEEFPDPEDVRIFCEEQLKRDISPKLYANYARHLGVKLNHLETPPRKYIDSYKERYGMRQYAVDSGELPLTFDNGKLHLDFDNNRVWINKNPSKFGEPAVKFTEVLAEHLGEPVNRKFLIDAVWGGDAKPQSYHLVLHRLLDNFGDADKSPDGMIRLGFREVTMVPIEK